MRLYPESVKGISAMNVTIKYMGQLRHIADKDSEQIECGEGAGLVDVLRLAANAYDDAFARILFDEAGAIRQSVMIMVNDKPISKETAGAICDGDSMTILAAIAGG